MTRKGDVKRMAIKPILFNTEMVRAILDGKKTCTRRIVKGAIPDDAMWGYTMFTPKGCVSCRGVYADEYGEKFFRLPYQQGDILYVRETWQFLYELDDNEQPVEETGKYYYAATDITLFNTYVDENGGETRLCAMETIHSHAERSSENLAEGYRYSS